MAFDISTAKPAGFDIESARAVEEPQAPTQEAAAAEEPIPEGGLYESIVEPAQAIAAGTGGQIISGLAGMATAPFVGLEESSDIIKSIQEGAAEMGAPETKAGQESLQTLGDLVQKGIDIVNIPISGLAGVLELISGQGVEQAAKTVESVKEKGVGYTAGERAFEITGDPLLAATASMSPEIVGSIIPITKIAGKNIALRQKMANQILSGGTDKKLAKYMVNGAGRLKADPVAKEAINQGFDQGVVAVVKGASVADKAKLKEMTGIMKQGRENALFAMKNRPSDVAGRSLLDRVKYVKQVNRDAGSQLDNVAKSLKGQKVSFDEPINNFINTLDEMGIKINNQLQPVFKGSDVEGLAAPERAIKGIIKRLSSGRRGEIPDAYELHRMKKFIDETVTYGKQGEGLAGKTERVLKKLRADLDSALDQQFPEYNKINTQYADTVSALDALQDVAGKKMDLFGPNADKATGTLLRRMMSNVQSRVNLVDAVDSLESTAKKYGAAFDDDIATQMLYADELDNVFGPVAKSSLAGETAKGMRKAGEYARGRGDRTVFGTIMDVGEAAYKKVKGATPEKAFSSIEELLGRE